MHSQTRGSPKEKEYGGHRISVSPVHHVASTANLWVISIQISPLCWTNLILTEEDSQVP